VDARQFLHLRDSLSHLRDTLAQYAQPLGHSPQPGSKAEREIGTFIRAESVHTAQGQAWILLEVSADQLTAFVKTATDPMETIAPFTCVRSLLEAGALACWLLDPAIDVKRRISRSIALRYEGMAQQSRWAKSAGEDQSKAERRRSDIIADAQRLGYLPINDRRGRPAGAGQRMPKVTDVIRDMLDEEAVYRLLSAVAHGHHWALQQLSFTRVPESDEISAHSGTKLSAITKTANVTGLAYMAIAAAGTFARTVWYQASYLGWDQTQLRLLLEAEFDQMGTSDAVRFWRAGARG